MRLKLEEVLVLTALVAQAVVLDARHLACCDAPNHLGRYVQMERSWFGPAPTHVEASPRPTNHVGLDLIAVGLVRCFPRVVAAKLLALTTCTAPGIGLDLPLLAASPGHRGWSLVGSLLGSNRYHFLGFYDDSIGIGPVFLRSAAYFLRKARPARFPAGVLSSPTGPEVSPGARASPARAPVRSIPPPTPEDPPRCPRNTRSS